MLETGQPARIGAPLPMGPHGLSGAARGTLAPLVANLCRIARLDHNDVAAIHAWPHRVQSGGGGDYLAREGQLIDQCSVLLDGHAYHSRLTGEGARQIVAFGVAGDLVGLQTVEPGRADHNVQLLDAAIIAWIPREAIWATMAARPSIARALWRTVLIDASILREWVLNVGRRDARSRIAHLLCEFVFRHEVAQCAGSQKRFDLPMTQEQIADATGLTPVHVSRMLHHLAEQGLIERERRRFHVLDWEALRALADFDPAYLHHA